MPSKERPGTPSMSAGRMKPCQWIELRSRRRFVTRKVTVSPWRMRKSGAGICPLIATAVRSAPVKFTGSSPIERSNSGPLSTEGLLRSLAPQEELRNAPASTALPASPCTKRRRVSGAGVGRVHRENDIRLPGPRKIWLARVWGLDHGPESSHRKEADFCRFRADGAADTQTGRTRADTRVAAATFPASAACNGPDRPEKPASAAPPRAHPGYRPRFPR